MFKHLPVFVIAAALATSVMHQAQLETELEPGFIRQRRGKGHNNRRGTGRVSAPKRRSNRLHVSKRVRRKHRRAA